MQTADDQTLERAALDIALAALDQRDIERFLRTLCDRLARLDGWDGVFVVLLDAAGRPAFSASGGSVVGLAGLLEAFRAGDVPACWAQVQVRPDPLLVTSAECGRTDCPLEHDGTGLRVRVAHGRAGRGLLGVQLARGCTLSANATGVVQQIAELTSLALTRDAATRLPAAHPPPHGDRLATVG